MYKRNLFGYRSSDRSPFGSVGNHVERASSKSRGVNSSKLYERSPLKYNFSFKFNKNDQNLTRLSKNASVGRLQTVSKERSPNLLEKASKTLSKLTNKNEIIGTDKPADLKEEVPSKMAVKYQINKSKTDYDIKNVNLFSRKDWNSSDKHPNSTKKLIPVQNPKNEKERQNEVQDRVENQSHAGFPVSSELLLHEFQIESIKYKNQINNLKSEIQNALEVKQQKGSEIAYLAKKTIEMATENANKDSEILNLKHQLNLSQQNANQLKNQVNQSQIDFIKIKQELSETRHDKDKLEYSLKDDKREKKILTIKLMEKEATAQADTSNIVKLEKDKEVLIGLVEKLQQELSNLRKSNEEALEFLKMK